MKQNDHIINWAILFLIVALLLITCRQKIQQESYKTKLLNGANIVRKAPIYSDYELNIISEDSIAVFDGQRYVGTITFTDDSEIGKLILKDNE
jgi:hypothetical protein